MIREADGSDRPYLLLRLIPVEYLQNTWTFPTEFPLAEISMIVSDGGYVVQSPFAALAHLFRLHPRL